VIGGGGRFTLRRASWFPRMSSQRGLTHMHAKSSRVPTRRWGGQIPSRARR
jgi:hypothetical protein